MKAILVERGMTASDAAATAAKIASSAANVTAAATTETLANSTTKLKTVMTGLKASILAHPILTIVSVLTTAITIISRVAHAVKQAKEEAVQHAREVADAYDDSVKSLENTKKELDELLPRYSKLSDGVDGLNKNVSLSSEEYDEYIEICNKIKDMFPSLVVGYNEQGDVILSCKGKVEELTAAYDEMAKSANSAVISQGAVLFGSFKDQIAELDKESHQSDRLTRKGIERLREALQSADLMSELNNIIPSGTTFMVQVVSALKDAGITQNFGESGHGFIKRGIQENRAVVEAIVSEFEKQIDEATSGINWCYRVKCFIKRNAKIVTI